MNGRTSDLHKYRQIGCGHPPPPHGEQLAHESPAALLQLDQKFMVHFPPDLLSARLLSTSSSQRGVRQARSGGLHNGASAFSSLQGTARATAAMPNTWRQASPGGLHIAVSTRAPRRWCSAGGTLEASAGFSRRRTLASSLVLKGLAILSLQDHLARFLRQRSPGQGKSIHHNGPPYQNSLNIGPY